MPLAATAPVNSHCDDSTFEKTAPAEHLIKTLASASALLQLASHTLCYRELLADVFRICAVEAVVWQRLTVTVVPM